MTCTRCTKYPLHSQPQHHKFSQHSPFLSSIPIRGVYGITTDHHHPSLALFLNKLLLRPLPSIFRLFLSLPSSPSTRLVTTLTSAKTRQLWCASRSTSPAMYMMHRWGSHTFPPAPEQLRHSAFSHPCQTAGYPLKLEGASSRSKQTPKRITRPNMMYL